MHNDIFVSTLRRKAVRFCRSILTLCSLLTFCWLLAGCSFIAPNGSFAPVVSGNHKSTPAFSTVPSDAPVLPPTTHIALLVPLQGTLGPTGQAVRNGFLAAYYSAKQQSSTNIPSIDVIDSSSGNIISLYQKAVDSGANMIVGPLTKNNLQLLTNAGSLSVPTLALNTLDNNQRITNLYQFGLSPLDGSEQAAQRARQQGHSRALIIAPAGAWGQNIAHMFSQTFTATGGTIVSSMSYPDHGNLDIAVRSLLQVQQSTPPKLKGGLKQKTMITHRQDADMIFVVAFPQQARQIKSLLAFYYAGDMPVYATSQVYSGIPAPQYDQDLDGVEFCDMPWLLDNTRWTDIRTRIQTLWASSYNQYPRLYGLGIDAYRLAEHISELQSGYNGATGTLFINEHGRIIRQLTWARMQAGVPQLIQ
jgi:outer membrane PBP1 activator LpoA protein